VPNLRDAGGYTTADGSMVRRGIAYRANQLNPISPADLKKIADLGLKNDFDLRTAEEREAKPEILPPGVKDVWLNVRTGWASAALLTLLGVPEDKVYEGYLRSNEYILPAYKSFIDHFVAAGGDPSIPHDILGVKAEYLQASFDQVKTQYGSIENYFDKGLGIDRAHQQKLRDQFLQSNK
jgi:protein tyrosine/serine phosphatase